LSKVKSKDDVGNVLYNRGMFNAVVVAEAIHVAQTKTGKTAIDATDMREGMENIDLSAERLAELGLENFTSPIKGSCSDHEGAGSVFIQQWNGSDWERVSDLIPPMNDVVRPLLEAAADTYVSDKPDWKVASCG